MTRHGKNCTAGAVYTYHEKQKDSKTSGYGSKNVRLGKDSVQEFDCCSLTLQPCSDPVMTPEGHLYDKEPLLEFILQKKIEIKKKFKEFEKQKSRHKKEEKELERAAKESHLQNFVAKQSIGKVYAGASTSGLGNLSNMQEGKDIALPSFWVPTLTPNATETQLKKPDEKVRCPLSGRVLRLKDLIPVKFTLIKDGKKDSLIAKQSRYVCAVTNDVLGNSVPCALLKTSGSVVTMECVEKIIKKDMIDPTNGKPITEADIIPFQRGASGFAGSGITLHAKKEGAALQV